MTSPEVQSTLQKLNDLILGKNSSVSNSGDDEPLPDTAGKGVNCVVKNLYYAPVEGKPGMHEWVDQVSGSARNESMSKEKQNDTCAIILYHKPDEHEIRFNTSSIRINSPRIKSVLRKVLEGYPGLTQYSLDTFSPPFYPFIHRWEQLKAYIAGEHDAETLKHLLLLLEVLTPRVKDLLKRAETIKSTGHAAFEDLILAYYPGELLWIFDSSGHESAGVFRSATVGKDDKDSTREVLWVAMDVLNWDGKRCGLEQKHWIRPSYEGVKALTALDIVPLNAHPEQEIIRRRLIARGRIFERLRGQHFLARTADDDEVHDERVIVDAKGYHKSSADGFPKLASLDRMGPLTWKQAIERSADVADDIDDGQVDISPMTDDQCLLAAPTVKCFRLAAKEWALLNLTKLHQIPWNEQAFDRLVLDAGEKDMLLALVDRGESQQKKCFDDFISGKGQGMIMLLCGPPGVGKTLTAEAVAEHLRHPLYRMGAGNLGTTAKALEESLDKALKLCANWNAVLLLDEADVFMEARTSHNLPRNELVSVFLRQIEYYTGIMILTTNRIQSLDPAFESRIDITLAYNPLNETDRMQVWKNFLVLCDSQDVKIGDDDLEKLAKCDLNGRQIKSAIKTARILASKKKEPLSMKHLNLVLNLRRKALSMMSGGEVEVNEFQYVGASVNTQT